MSDTSSVLDSRTQTSLWQRLESLRPSLPRHIHIQRRDYQGELWYLLQDKTTGRFHRLTPSAWRLINAMNGHRSLIQVLAEASRPELYNSPDDIPTRDDLIHLLQYLHVADLLVCDIPPNTQELFARREKKKSQVWQRLLVNPLSWNIPLGNPNQLLDKCMPLARVLATRSMGFIWLLVVGFAVLQAGVHWTELTHGQLDRVLSPSNLFLLWLTYPLFKILHELGHGLFTKVWGGQVNDCGVIFMLGTPLPYVDATAATGFPFKHQRLMVGAAGMAVELFLAALALLLWLQLPHGFWRDFLYNIILIGSVSTLFFNGNPLMRYDGYHLLTDLIDTPNLATRANQQLLYWVKRYAYAMQDVFSPAASQREAILFTTYSLAAFFYRLLVLFGIIFLVASYFPMAGLVIGGWLIAVQLFWPLFKGVVFLVNDKQLAAQRTRAVSVTAISFSIVILFILIIPLPYSTTVEGVVWLSDDARVKAKASGEVIESAVKDGEAVTQGQLLVRLSNPVLRARLAGLQLRLQEYEVRYQREWGVDLGQAQIVEEDIAAIKEELALLQSRVDNLALRSPSAGIFRRSQPHMLQGSFVHEGDELAIIEKPETLRVRIALLQEDMGDLTGAKDEIFLRFASAPSQKWAAKAVSGDPIASQQLPSAVLGTLGGGRIPVDATQSAGTSVKEKVFLVDLAVSDIEWGGHVGERAYVKFIHPAKPLVYRWYSHWQQVFIRHFS